MGYGKVAALLGRMEVAENAWRKAREIEPRNHLLMLEIGHEYETFREPEKARTLFREAVKVAPSAVNPRISLALIEEKEHRFVEARAEVEEILRGAPSDEQARFMSALLDHRENQIARAESLLRDLIVTSPKHEYLRYAVRYELAHILDKTGRFDEAMQMLREAKDCVRRLTDIDILNKQYDYNAELVRRAAQQFPKSILRSWAKTFPPSRRRPIPKLAFLGGHPRSGTTLIEQILGAHPQIQAIDEPNVMGIAANASSAAPSAFSINALNIARDRYIQALCQGQEPQPDGKVLVEKNPTPTAHLPSLLRVFPELRVIIAIRDPRDVVLSCYFQNLPLNNVNANFLSLERLAKHYADLMNVWMAVREWDDFNWIETRYEDIVNNLGVEGPRVTEFLGLKWHETQTRYFENSTQKRLYSPTYHEVTQPVYSRSVGRWRHYEKYLAPILTTLKPYCDKFGYT